MIKIMLSDRRFNIDSRRLRLMIKTLMENESAGEKTINIVYCNHRLMRDLNDKFMGKKRTTDVLAFGLDDGDDDAILGEVYVNLQQARMQADDHKIKYNEEVERLTVHGVLHLLGYDDHGPKNHTRMWNRQESYLKQWKK